MPLSRDPAARARQLANLTRRPPAPPRGNGRALRHGAHARKATLIRAGSWAALILAELEAEAPLRDEDGALPAADRQLVELLASALARLEAVSGWLELRPAVDELGREWPAEQAAHRLRLECARYLEALGMSPTSRAALGLNIALTESATPRVIGADEPERRERILALLSAATAPPDEHPAHAEAATSPAPPMWPADAERSARLREPASDGLDSTRAAVQAALHPRGEDHDGD